MLAGCRYVRGEVRRTDWVVRNLYTNSGLLSPPYWTKTEIESILFKLFALHPTHTALAMLQADKRLCHPAPAVRADALGVGFLVCACHRKTSHHFAL
jgi:hypothetical protein